MRAKAEIMQPGRPGSSERNVERRKGRPLRTERRSADRGDEYGSPITILGYRKFLPFSRRHLAHSAHSCLANSNDKPSLETSLVSIMTAPKQEPQEAVLPPPKRPAATEKARKEALKTITAVRRVSAWQIHRWPLEKRIVNERTRVHLPRTYLAKDGIDVRVVRPGQDLNQFVHRHYSEQLGLKDTRGGKEEEEWRNWVNFVTPDGVLKRR